MIFMLLMVIFICYIPSKGFVNYVLKGVGEVFVSQELNNSSSSSPAAVLLIVLGGNRYCSVEPCQFKNRVREFREWWWGNRALCKHNIKKTLSL